MDGGAEWLVEASLYRLNLCFIWDVAEVEEEVWEDTGFQKIKHLNRWAADGRVGVMLVIAEGVRDSEGEGVSFICLSLGRIMDATAAFIFTMGSSPR